MPSSPIVGQRSPSLLLYPTIIATVWVALYALNDWLFEHVAVSVYASWVFLPAALRMLAVMLCGWVGVLGLFVGSMITGYYTHGLTDPGMLVVLAGLSALAPMMAFLVCTHWFGWRGDLRGLSAMQLVVLSTLVSFFGASLHNLHFLTIGAIDGFGSTFMTMFVGDMAGTFIVLYGAKFLLGLLPLDKEPLV